MTELDLSRAHAAPTLGATAVAVGGYRWLAARLFEVLGTWVATVPEPAVAVALAAQAHHHAWHAELWAERLPRVAHLDPEALTAPPGPGAAAVLDELAAADATTTRLAGLGRVVLPRLTAALDAHLERASPVADRGLARTLGLVLADVEADRRQAERLLQGLLGDEAGVRRAAGAAADLEALIVGGEGWRLGPGVPAPGAKA